METVKYGLIGSKGKMGSELFSLLQSAGHSCVLRSDKDFLEAEDSPLVIIDFSLPEALVTTIELAEKYNAALIIGTTGLNDTDISSLKELSKTVPVVQSYNFSIGIQMLLRALNSIKNEVKDWDMEISETHHRFKKDKPSGTAIMIKEQLKEIKEVPVSSFRLGSVPGEHTVYFGSIGEILSIKHTALSRRTFAEGAARCIPYVIKKKNGFYSFKDVLDNI